MILADKIINERKKNGWSQEELADKLSVSRQSVSKWEGAQSVPDLNRIIKMAELFNVSIDYLLKDEIESEENDEATIESGSSLRKVSMEEASSYLKLIKDNNLTNSIAIALFVLCPTVLIMLAGLSQKANSPITENMAGGLGLLVLFIFVAIGIALTVMINSKEKKYDYLKTEDFDTEYGVSGMVKELIKNYEAKHTMNTIISVILFIFSAIPLLASAFMEAPDWVTVMMVCVLLIMVAIGCSIITYSSRIMSSYKTLLEERKDRKKLKAEKTMSNINTIYWLVAVIGFFVLNMILKLWAYTGVYWIIAGLLYGVVIAISKMFIDKE